MVGSNKIIAKGQRVRLAKITGKILLDCQVEEEKPHGVGSLRVSVNGVRKLRASGLNEVGGSC